MSDEHRDSLAAQAASWVPPWERPQPPLDRDFQASSADEPDTVDQPGDDEKIDEADLAEDDDDFDEAFEGPNPPGYTPTDSAADADGDGDADADGDGDGGSGSRSDVPPELPPIPGESTEPVTVDAPTELEGDSRSPLDVGIGPDIDVPLPIEEAAEAAEDEDGGDLVDAPLPPDGDDAGDVFDAAADDDVSDDDDVDMPFTEDVPGADPDDDPDESTGDGPGEDTDESSADGGGDSADPAGAAAGATQGVGPGVIPGQGRRVRAATVPDQPAEVRTGPDLDFDLAPLGDTELRAALEAILLVVDEPVAEMQLAQIVEQPTERVATLLDDISARYTAAGHGFDLRRAAGGWRLYTRPEYAAYVERFVLDGQSVRLTQAALETLSVVAYKQPVTRSRISAIRGVNCDGVMRTLTTRGLIEECGTEGETGAYLYRTTGLFLEKLGLNSVDQLPPLAPFLPDDVEEVLDASG